MQLLEVQLKSIQTGLISLIRFVARVVISLTPDEQEELEEFVQVRNETKRRTSC